MLFADLIHWPTLSLVELITAHRGLLVEIVLLQRNFSSINNLKLSHKANYNK